MPVFAKSPEVIEKKVDRLRSLARESKERRKVHVASAGEQPCPYEI
jgi:hypothetical protein